MRKIDSSELKKLNIFKHYRIIRKWVSRKYNIKEADFELLMYLDAIDRFTKQDFKTGSYSYSWDNRRWNRLLKEDWIVVWRKRNRSTQMFNIYQVSFKCKQLISRIYRIMTGEDDLPVSKRRNKLIAGNSYTDKVLTKAIYNVNKDKQR